MFHLDLIFISAIFLVSAVRALQYPFRGDAPTDTRSYLKVSDGGEDDDWRFDETPPVNTTDHLVFETVSSLLQHWPNTRYRNGHTIVPGVVPLGTLLYHGTFQNVVPDHPEWLATDPEHSHAFCRGASGASCWHLTLSVTRPLNILYFDGSSAAKMEGGPMDSQDVVAWGEFRTNSTFNERQRIVDLCVWGRQYSLDGFHILTMFDSEVMLCNFTEGVKVVSFLRLPDLTIVDRERLPTQAFRTFEMMNAGHWHDRFPGEGRVQLDLSRLISFYDPELVPSLVAQRFGKERWDHRLLGTDATDIAAVQNRLAEVLEYEHVKNSVDWRALIRVIVDRYAERLELMQHFLHPSTATTETESVQDTFERAEKVQLQLRIMLTPYILHSSFPSQEFASSMTKYAWASPVFQECATMHTAAIASDLMSTLTPSERLILKSIQATSREICRVAVRMWAEGVESGLDQYLPAATQPFKVKEVTRIWKEDLTELMNWLDWNIWVKCRPACGFEEMCYLPTWPIGFERRKRPEELSSQPEGSEDSEEWRRPQPKCIRRAEPYRF
ncbi:hypothetical protein BJ138DRAFT_1008581 [Hygrophoropsis aurantiaca]|uniref:Uncharacterized protein n=1 Tax=Hygrophoropsis aurantiaca TaxID=72124 RepID=A0ACB8ABI3_9AGAM|nr:hypothetical protein BJ138DRAFT_1008581 [Hygrophoropsis aurantiaca]